MGRPETIDGRPKGVDPNIAIYHLGDRRLQGRKKTDHGLRDRIIAGKPTCP